MTPRRITAIAMLAVLAACGPQVGAGDSSGGDSGSASSVDSSTGTSVGTTVGTSVGTSVGTTVATTDDGDDGDTSDPVKLDLPTTCSQWAQDCPPGYKCSIRAQANSTTWDETACVPIDADPKPVGAACSVGDEPLDGIDDCERGALCWLVDFTSDVGTCVAFCTGSEAEPMCEGACEWCAINSSGLTTLCFERCDPLLQDCDDAQGCYPHDDVFACAPDQSDTQMIGSPCEYVNVCPAGLACIDAEVYPDCMAASGCCSPYCNVDAPVDPCDALAPGTVCTPWSSVGTPDACTGTGTVGVCAAP